MGHIVVTELLASGVCVVIAFDHLAAFSGKLRPWEAE